MKLLKSNKFKLILKLIVSIVLLSLIFRFIGIGKIYNELLNTNLYYIALSILFIFFEIFFRAIRWNAIVQIFNKSISVASAMYYTLISIAFGFVTPGRLGEFVKAKYLVDRTNISYLKSFMTVVIDKIFDVMALVFLGLAGFSFFGKEIIKSNYPILALILYILILVLVFVFFDKVLILINNFLPQKYRGNFKNFNIGRGFYAKSIFLSF